MSNGSLPTLKEVGEATLYKQKVIEKKTTSQNAPNWAQDIVRDFNTLQTTVNNIQNTVNNIQTTVNNIQNTIRASERRNQARISNSFSVSDLDPFQGLPDDYGVIPNNFPTTVGDLKTINSETITPILQAYGLQTNGLIEQKRNELGTYIGCLVTFS